jgi:hypothetical protein
MPLIMTVPMKRPFVAVFVPSACAFGNDVIEGSFELGIEDIFLLLLGRIEDGFDSIMTGTSWSEPIGIGFKSGFPFWLKGEFGEMLPCSFFHDGNA